MRYLGAKALFKKPAKMQKSIFKFCLLTTGDQFVKMPINAEILKLDIQAGVPCLWALVDPDDPISTRRFRIYGTGHVIETQENESMRYVDTYQLEKIGGMFHVFELTQTNQDYE